VADSVWSVEEARAYLPRLRALLELVRKAAVVSARARSNGHRDTDDAGDSPQTSGAAGEPGDLGSPPVEELGGLGPAEAMAEIEARGIIVRDLERGLVDFPSRHPGGREVLLCWKLGEPDLTWWHLPDDGFAGRRPLPLPPEL
jgi:hypothetical protein